MRANLTHPHLPCQRLPRLETLAGETSFGSSCYLPSSKLSVAHIPGLSTSPALASIMMPECLTPQGWLSVHAPKNKQRLVRGNFHPSFMIRPPILSLTGSSPPRAGKSTARTPSPSYVNHLVCIYIAGLKNFVRVESPNHK